MTKTEALSELSKLWDEARRVGSRFTCNPAPIDTDEDWLVLCQDRKALVSLIVRLERDGWDFGESSQPEDDHDDEFGLFVSVGKRIDRTDINLIITRDSEFFRRFWAATTIAKSFNLMKKKDRIALFQAVLYGNANPSIAPERFGDSAEIPF